MAIAWLLKDPRITSVLVGASSVKQMADNVGVLKNMTFEKTELDSIGAILKS
jgi:L-glyceraldehyde 3-phosphate reductase